MLSEPVSQHGAYQALSAEATHRELLRIADWWAINLSSPLNGGFFGELDHFAKPDPDAPISIILISRVLWFFSAASLQVPNGLYREVADRAYQTLIDHFDDAEVGGVVWEVSSQHQITDAKKQIYAHCFSIYALSAYYSLTTNANALSKALEYFNLIEKFARDEQHGGYIEACDRQWRPTSSWRLSQKDMNLPKSMNTHLHIIEAYTELYKVCKRAELKEALRYTVHIFDTHIINHSSFHTRMFFSEDWQDHSECLSYGHDIEASWLICKAAKTLEDEDLVSGTNTISISMVNAVLANGMGDEGQVLDEFNLATRRSSQDSVWWVQAEALVGFLNAFKITHDHTYLEAAKRVWRFIHKQHIDHEFGDWHWLASPDSSLNKSMYKAGAWKGPYHNGRAMLEATQHLAQLEAM